MKDRGEKWPGLPERLRAAMRQAGHWKGDRPDVLGFSLEHRFLAGYLYKYLDGTAVPSRENLLRLSAILDVSPAWLLFGDEEPKRKPRRKPVIAGGSAAAATPPVATAEGQLNVLSDGVSLIRPWWPQYWGSIQAGTQYFSLKVRQEMLFDRWRLRAA